MKIRKRDGSKPRMILIGMIVDSLVVGRISARWRKFGLFKSKWENQIGEWCVNYYQKYKKAPGKDIQGIYENWAEETNSDEEVEAVGRFLEGLSNQYKRL